MLEETGRIVELDGEYAWVESERTSTCGSCSVRQGCGTSAIARVLGRKRLRLRAVNQAGAAVGDHVIIGITESGLVRGSLAVYAVPLAGLLAGAVAGHTLAAGIEPAYQDLAAIGGALAGLAVAIAWLRNFSRRTATDTAWQPVVLRRDHRLPTS